MEEACMQEKLWHVDKREMKDQKIEYLKCITWEQELHDLGDGMETYDRVSNFLRFYLRFPNDHYAINNLM